MLVNEYDDISINGQFDLAFQEKSPDHPVITWKLLKSVAFNLSELQPYVEGGLFRIPHRLYIEYDGRDPYDPADNIATASRIFTDWWERLWLIPEDQRIYFIILAFKLKIYNVEYLMTISTNFDDFYHYFSPGLIAEIKKIVVFLKVI